MVKQNALHPWESAGIHLGGGAQLLGADLNCFQGAKEGAETQNRTAIGPNSFTVFTCVKFSAVVLS